MKLQKKIIALAVVIILAAFMLPATAGAETISADMVISTGHGTNYKSWSNKSRPGYEMEVSLTADGLDLTDYETYGYCVDPWQGIGDGSYSVELTYLSELSTTYGDTFYQIAWLLDTFAGESGVSSTNDGDSSYYTDDPKKEAAALQALIWATLTGDSWSYGAKQSSSIRNQYDYYSYQLANHTLTDSEREYLSENYMVAVSTSYQDIIVRLETGGGDVPAVPEPGTMILFGSAAGLMALYRRRKKNSGEQLEASEA